MAERSPVNITYLQGSSIQEERDDVDNDVTFAAKFADHASFYALAPLRKLDGLTYLRFDPLGKKADIPWYAVMTKIVTPALVKTRPSLERTQDTREMACIAIALKIWKQRHMDYPKTLQELKSMPIASLQNALKRKTIGYKTQCNNFLLYSFGLNRRDDGGKSGNYNPLKPNSQNFNDQDDDIFWQQSLGIRKIRS